MADSTRREFLTAAGAGLLAGGVRPPVRVVSRSVKTTGPTREVLAPYVERGEVPGLVALVERQGREDLHALGVKTLGKPGAVERDTIFRIASMTKPVTATA